METLFRISLPLLAIISLTVIFMEQTCEAKEKFPVDRVTNPNCNSDCKDSPTKLLCGSDGRTYNSRCELQYAKCLGKQIQILNKGKCVEKTKCQGERDSSISVASTNSNPSTNTVFIPQCNPDGSYSSIQCHRSFGYCWCVDDLGKPLPGTSVRYQRPSCDGGPAGGPILLTHPPVLDNEGDCSQADRDEFNTNLKAKFREEYDRLPASETSNHLGDLDMRIIQWKFDQLDADENDEIDLSEVKSFQRMLKKFVKPKKCAKTFFVHCSSTHEGQITRKAWSECLGLETSMIEKAFWMLSPSPSGTKVVAELRDISVEVECCGQPLLEEVNTRIDESIAEPPKKKPSASVGINKCNVERADALNKSNQDPDSGVFIPRCIENNYDPVQCHEEAKYCWCVNITTGRPIIGTSKKVDVSVSGFESALNCNHNTKIETSTSEVVSTPSPPVFKGCTGSKQAKFLSSVIDMLITEMMGDPARTAAQTDGTTDQNRSVTERVARWKFLHMDTNSNSMIDKRELKGIKSQVDELSGRKKCKRNFLSYCDSNNNSKLTMNEWLKCLGIEITSGPPTTTAARRGKNPFSILS